ncbi:alpha/beta hydrolase [Georgenia sp. TF02-10]|uniref:esterase/lipase family protein n=1 Tax=Georgenia sp. TF02-10 TaxID=2917725 RepID=UPI001FA73A98|nr:alpha/beta hydrolase [Georgenia sp. TF02-10]UNX54389.1 alpha/beta hydrolase [Georgenia sp. TF02-10]
MTGRGGAGRRRAARWQPARRWLAGARPRTWAADYAWAARRLAGATAEDLRARAAGRRGLPGAAGADLAPGEEAGRLAAGPRAPVLLLPGIYESWRFLSPLAEHLQAAGHEVHVVDALGLNRRDAAEGARRAGAYLAARDLRGVVLVAHSKGGLVGRALMLSPDGARVRGLVAVATPWRGSPWAWLFPPFTALGHLAPTARDIRAAGRRREVDARIVSLSPAWDPHVPGGSHLPGARNVDLAAAGHFLPLADPVVLAEITTAVAELSGR